MKGMKGRFLKKLKSISTITSLRQGISVFQVNPSNQNFHTSTVDKEQADANNNPRELCFDSKHIPELANQFKDEEIDSAFHTCHRENFGPHIESKDEIPIELLESGNTNANTVPLPVVQLWKESENCDLKIERTSSDQLNENSDAFFDPELDLLVIEDKSTNEAKEDNEELPTLLDFEEKCPPGGRESVILYTTSMRGIRKTYEDCTSVRFLLESFRVFYYERDVSMHLEFREELWRILGSRVVPPKLFIKGRHIGGAEEVVGLHEQGLLRKLLRGLPLNPSDKPCNGCGGVRFVVCFNCNGSHKVIPEELTSEMSIRCPECNENGLIKCPICC